MLVSEAKTLAFSQYRDVEPPGQELFISIINRINQNDYDMLTELDPERYLSSAVEITATPQTLESDFDTMKANYTKVFRLNSDSIITTIYNQTSNASPRLGYYINDTQIVLTPPTIDIDNIYYRYIPTISDITADTDTLAIPDRFKMKTVYELCAQDALINDEPSDIVRRFQEQAKEVEMEMIKQYKRAPEVLKFGTYINPNKYLTYRHRQRW